MSKVFVLSSIVALVFPFQVLACADAKEADAFDLRALKNSLMVAALTCDQESSYNSFVNRHKNNLTSSGAKIEEYFKRTYGRNYERELNSFITNLANKASSNAAKQDATSYCATAKEIFRKLARANSYELGKVADEKQFVSLHNIDSCS